VRITRCGRSGRWVMRSWRRCRRNSRGLSSSTGRPSIPPEKLLRAMPLQAFYSIRSERLECDLLFKWFVGLGIDDGVWDHPSFSKNRDRLLDGEVAAKFLAAVLVQPRVKRLLSSEHFSVDGTLIEAWASMKSFKRKDPPEGGPPRGGGRYAPTDFKGEKRSNETHASTTDPDARLYRKGPGMEAKLCYIGHGLMENRSGLIVDARLMLASGHAERLAALDMIASPGPIARARSGGGRPGLQRGRLRRRASDDERPSPSGAEHERAALGDRPATTRHWGYEAKPAYPKTDRSRRPSAG
jgi:transposase